MTTSPIFPASLVLATTNSVIPPASLEKRSPATAGQAGMIPISLPSLAGIPASVNPRGVFSNLAPEAGNAGSLVNRETVASSAVPVIFKSFAQLSSGLHPDEVANLQDVFDDHKIINIEASGLGHLGDWLERLNERLTVAVEKTGEFYPEYRISVMDGDEPQAFVYKFRSPGQKFYRGHVFFSAGLVRRMAATLLKKKDDAVGADAIAALTDGEITQVMKGIQGAIAHEFSHPKQDELIKWEWRASQDQSRQTHGQADEMSTDLMGIKLLKDAELEPSSLLAGLELIFGYQPSTGNLLWRGAASMLSSHPEEKLRLNIVRGGLVRLRRDEGKSPVRPLEIDAGGLRADLTRVVNILHSDSKLTAIEKEAQAKGESFVVTFAGEMLTQVKKSADAFGTSGPDKYATFLEWMGLLKTVLRKNPDLNSEEDAAVLSVLQQVKSFGGWQFWTDMWNVEGSGSSGVNPFEYSYAQGREAQRLFADHPVFALPAVREWLANGAEGADMWDFANRSLHFLPFIMHSQYVLAVYRAALARLDELPADARVMAVLQMISGFQAMGGASDELELKIVRKLRELASISQETAKIVVENLNNVTPGQKEKRAFFLERFLAAGEKRQELITEWKALLTEALRHPDPILRNYFGIGASIGRSDITWFWEILQWAAVPGDFLKTFHAGVPLDTDRVATEIETILRGEAWRDYLRENFATAAKNGSVARAGMPLFQFYGMPHLLARDDLAFTGEQRLRFADAMFSAAEGAAPDSDLFKGRVFFEVATLHDLDEKNTVLLRERAARFHSFLKSNGVTDVLGFLDGLYGNGPEGVLDNVFANGSTFILVLDDWRERGFIDEARFGDALERYVFSARPRQGNSTPLEQLSQESAYALWRHARSKDDPRAVLELFRAVAGAFRVKPSRGGVEALSEETRRYLQAGVETAPGYAKFFEFIKDGIVDDLRRSIGVNRKIAVGDAAYAEALRRNYDAALEFAKLVFNPDGKGVPSEFRGLVKYHNLDDPAETLLALFPKGALSDAQYGEVWNAFSAKRANRHTDTFFEENVYPVLKKLPETERAAKYRDILDGGRLRSERLKNELMAEALKSELKRLAERAGELSDRDVRPLIEIVTSRIPDSSRFRDDLLEKIAWKLELSEAQLAKFVEPLKSFNFRTMNPLTVNLLSSLSVVLEKLKNSEKLALIRYFKEPKGALRSVLPWLGRLNDDVNAMLLKYDIKDFDWLDHLESFVRDAGEGDRLVLIELLVGSRGSGLWHAEEKWRDELYKIAELEPGSTKRKLFDSYLKALPPYEHSVTLSYLIATQGEGGGGSELLRILEVFDTPGIKFAQMASVLGIFGPERSEELAQAKDRALPPTRALVFEELRKHLTAEEFARIKRVRRLLGSGSVKFVALVEYDDGSKEAVSIRRPFLDERIASTMDIVSLWSEELRKDEEFAKEYDFDYYLEALRKQLSEEVQFPREVGLAQGMADEYARIPEHKGWRFEPVRPSMNRAQNDHILHFMAVEGAVPFDDLSAEDKVAASELVIAAELHLLFDRRHFDADRHMGNFLFDPETKRVYPIDMGQAYELESNGWFSPGEPYAVAEILYGVTDKDPERGAATLTRAFLRIEEGAAERDQDFARELSTAIAAILQTQSEGDPSRQLKMKTFKVLAELNKKRVRLPLRFTMGVVKGLMIVFNEKYAKAVDPEFITSRLEAFVRCQMAKGFRYRAFDWLAGR